MIADIAGCIVIGQMNLFKHPPPPFFFSFFYLGSRKYTWAARPSKAYVWETLHCTDVSKEVASEYTVTP